VAAILDQNAYLEKWGMDPIKVASVIIGNGLSDFYSCALSIACFEHAVHTLR
jgi:hypothetical protein